MNDEIILVAITYNKIEEDSAPRKVQQAVEGTREEIHEVLQNLVVKYSLGEGHWFSQRTNETIRAASELDNRMALIYRASVRAG